MKISILSIISFLLFLNVYSQHAPDAFLAKIPDIDRLSCDHESNSQFFKEVYQVRQDLEMEIKRRQHELNQNSGNIGEQASKNMMNQLGMPVSASDMQKMNTASKEEKKAMAMAMMQQNMNMSVEEAQKASKMSKAGKEAWAESMSTEMMADAQANPDKNKAAQTNNMDMVQMIQEQNTLAEKFQAAQIKFDKQLTEFQELKAEKQKEYDACLAPIAKERASRPNKNLGTDSHPDLDAKEKACYMDYCAFLTTEYKTLLKSRLSTIKAMAEDYYRMDELTNMLASSTSGEKKEISESGLTYLKELFNYMNHLDYSPIGNMR